MPARIMEQVLAWVDRAARPVLVQLLRTSGPLPQLATMQGRSP